MDSNTNNIEKKLKKLNMLFKVGFGFLLLSWGIILAWFIFPMILSFIGYSSSKNNIFIFIGFILLLINIFYFKIWKFAEEKQIKKYIKKGLLADDLLKNSKEWICFKCGNINNILDKDCKKCKKVISENIILELNNYPNNKNVTEKTNTNKAIDNFLKGPPISFSNNIEDKVIALINKHLHRVAAQVLNDKSLSCYFYNIEKAINGDLSQIIINKYNELIRDKSNHSSMVVKNIENCMTVFYFQYFSYGKMEVKNNLFVDSYIETTNLKLNQFLLSNNIDVYNQSEMKKINMFHIMLFINDSIEVDMGIFAAEKNFFLMPIDLLSEKDRKLTGL